MWLRMNLKWTSVLRIKFVHHPLAKRVPPCTAQRVGLLVIVSRQSFQGESCNLLHYVSGSLNKSYRIVGQIRFSQLTMDKAKQQLTEQLHLVQLLLNEYAPVGGSSNSLSEQTAVVAVSAFPHDFLKIKQLLTGDSCAILELGGWDLVRTSSSAAFRRHRKFQVVVFCCWLEFQMKSS
ncbi:hypothetical protein CRM22_007216 [Opisthorchis felineus]|uniref:Uncharacterized protein n=1 Tax=Opisthorchis felineus TaxID=147828 RepID=A0A4S2LGZ7_OPIFE|nr:hypothetical protein CRM22_007216 [Opisthorchis felineus]